jgi:putative nucleotidyltransferase with HDIG domain
MKPMTDSFPQLCLGEPTDPNPRLANLGGIPTRASVGYRQALDRLFTRIGDLSVLPAGAQHLVQLTKDPDCDLQDLQQLIQTDPSVVAQVLRRVNSSYYGLDKVVNDLAHAAQLVGFREVRNLAVTVYLSRMFEPAMSLGKFSRQGLWNHSVAVAATAHLVSRVCGRAVPADAYIAGLLHDIGLLVLNRQMRRYFAQVIEAVNEDAPTPDAERRIYLFDHAQLGAYVAGTWQFPRPVTDAIRFHHEVLRYSGLYRDLVYVVSVANYLCSRAKCTSMGVHNVQPPPDRVYRDLKLDEVALAIIWKELGPTLEKSSFLAET